jgi:SAM-dependent methyltransferase
MLPHPETFWQEVSARENWRDYILPRGSKDVLDAEGLEEASRLFYFFDSASTVVDYGCGIGRVLQYVAERAGHVVGLDISQNYLNRAKGFIKKNNVAFYQSGEYQKENVADLVYCLMVLQHNDQAHRGRIMGHIHTILKTGGTAVVNFPRYESAYYKEGTFIHKFKKEEVAALGSMFRSYRIIEGNLPNYEREYTGANEYFLIGVK